MRSQFDNEYQINAVKWTQIHSIPIRKRCTVLGTQVLSIHNQIYFTCYCGIIDIADFFLATNEFTIYPGNK